MTRGAGAASKRARPLPAAAAARPSRLASCAAPIAALVATLAYAPTLAFGFVWDDVATVVTNAHIQALRHLPGLFAEHAFAGSAALASGPHYYRPLWMTSLAIDHALWHDSAAGFHLTNVLLYAACCALLARSLLARVSPGAALTGAVLFALHPVHVEAVAWVSARNELLLLLFVLLADAAWRRVAAGRHRALIATTLASLAALLSKESAVVVPVLLALESWRAGAARAMRGALAGVAALVVTFLAIRLALMPAPSEPLPLATRVLSAPWLLVQYLRLLFVPWPLRTYHWVSTVTSPLTPAFLVPIAILAAYVVLVVWTARRDRTVAFGLTWVAVTLLPVCGLAGWPRPTPLAERYLLLPSVGWAVVVAAVVARAGATAKARRPAFAVALTVTVAFAALTTFQLPVWRDDLVLLERITHDAPKWPAGRAALARQYERAGRTDEAIAEYRAAADLEPDNPTRAVELAEALARAGRPDEAREVIRAGRTTRGLTPIEPPH